MHLFKKREENKRLKKPEKRPLPMSQAQRRFFLVYMAVTLSLTLGGIPVFASSDPLAVVNNLSDFVFSLIRAIGLILLFWKRAHGLPHEDVMCMFWTACVANRVYRLTRRRDTSDIVTLLISLALLIWNLVKFFQMT